MHLFLFSYHYLFIIFLWYRLFPFLSRRRRRRKKKVEREKKKNKTKKKEKENIIRLVLSFLSQPKIYFLLLYIYIYINQRICEYSRAVFLLLRRRVLAKFGADIILLFWFLLFLRTRIECAYAYKKEIISGIYIYIQEYCTILYSVVCADIYMFKSSK
jgi:hypothetical protein